MVGRRIVILRHGERVDFTFTDDWIKSCFGESTTYAKHNLNMPDTMPKRDGSPRTFLRDCPLTQVGELQATLTGKGLVSENVLREGFEVYVSPSLRCVQTAAAVGKGMGIDLSLKLEPCLFEWTGWYADFMPTWMTVPEFSENGFNVDASYSPLYNFVDINANEELDEFYERSYRVVLHILSKTDDKDILLVAHGSTLDTATRQLTGGPIRSQTEMMGILRGVPYCGLAVTEQDENSKKWSLIPVPKMTMRHASVHDFDASKAFSFGRGHYVVEISITHEGVLAKLNVPIGPDRDLIAVLLQKTNTWKAHAMNPSRNIVLVLFNCSIQSQYYYGVWTKLVGRIVR